MIVKEKLSQTKMVELIDLIKHTRHILNRQRRIDEYKKRGLFHYNFVSGFLVDKNHVDGDEYHLINSDGIIFILNANTLRLITIKGARGGQIYQYYAALRGQIPYTEYDRNLIQKAYDRENSDNPIHNL